MQPFGSVELRLMNLVLTGALVSECSLHKPSDVPLQ